jgi:uncharacterized linocin/CFP29 family protein
MIASDSAMGIPARNVEEWTKILAAYAEDYKDNMVARKILPIRNVGSTIDTDVVTIMDATDDSDILITAKGARGNVGNTFVSTKNFTIYQLKESFYVHERDLAQDPKLKAKEVERCTKMIHRKEDKLALNGYSAANITGITGCVAAANTITNNGAWDQSEACDMHQDILNAIATLNTNFEPSYILGNPTDINKLNGLDSKRQPYWMTIVDLFPGAKKKEDFLVKSAHVTAGNVYIGCKDPDAAELVISQNPKLKTYTMTEEDLFPVSLSEWLTVEIHDIDAFAKIPTT